VGSVGLHVRMPDTLATVADRALYHDLSFFQCFFLRQCTRRFFRPTNKEVAHFRRVYRSQFERLYVHGSYCSNLASTRRARHTLLERELYCAQRLGFTHIVLHPGSAKGAESRSASIDALARQINEVLYRERDVRIVLENVAFGKNAIGGDLYDFNRVLEKLDQPDRLGFCIDTAHAHAYGYPLQTKEQQNDFITLLGDTVGIDRIVLLHLNDTHEVCGSRIDKHGMVGQGEIGASALKRFITDVRLAHVPIILELPIVSLTQERVALQAVRSWRGEV